MKVVIAGGGTGGHLYPGIAIAREFLRRSGNEVLFVGTAQGIEARVLPKEGLPLRLIRAGKIKGMGIWSLMNTFLMLPFGVGQALRLLREERPAAVIGVGGYASAPVGVAAWLMRLPLFVIEPNSFPGLANRALGCLARAVVLSFPGNNEGGMFPDEKVLTTGPLVREGIDRGDRAQAMDAFGLSPGRFTVLVFGGSGGAHAINMAMKGAAAHLAEGGRIQVLHQTGQKDTEEVKQAYAAAGLPAVVLPYIDDMAGAYAAADLVVSRSGATTVAELAVCGKRSVLIPYPFAADNHQEYNARTLARHGLAEVVLQKDLNAAGLAALIRKYAGSAAAPGSRMGTRAAEEIVRYCTEHVQED